MTSFSRQIFSGNQSLDFYFDWISKGDRHKYHISVNKSFQVHHFTMDVTGERWRIVLAPAPEQWILALEKELEEAILNHETPGRI
jgi:hypothetical protein